MLVTVRNLFHDYDGAPVLERINLDVPAGEFCTIVGASGCGKSTFLRLLLSQERVRRGTIAIDGRPVAPEPGPARGVGARGSAVRLRRVQGVPRATERRREVPAVSTTRRPRRPGGVHLDARGDSEERVRGGGEGRRGATRGGGEGRRGATRGGKTLVVQIGVEVDELG